VIEVDARARTYDILYDDGETEHMVEESRMRALGTGQGAYEYQGAYDNEESQLDAVGIDMPDSSKGYDVDASGVPADAGELYEGARVEANYQGFGKWYPGFIAKDYGDGTYQITYDDGDAEPRVEAANIRIL
jgi:hypothetical protein